MTLSPALHPVHQQMEVLRLWPDSCSSCTADNRPVPGWIISATSSFLGTKVVPAWSSPVAAFLLPALLLQCCVGSRSYSSEYLQWLLSAACSTVCSTGQRCPPTLHHHYRTTVDIFVQVPLSENLLGVYPPGTKFLYSRMSDFDFWA